MTFVSGEFFLFFPIIVIIYFAIPHKFRWIWLLIGSYYFYMCWNPKYIILIGTTTIITYITGLLIESSGNIKDEKKSLNIKRLLVFLSVTSNLGILFLFKYYSFFTNSLIRLFSYFHIALNVPSFDHMIPVGISFYTFQALSYTIDVYRKDVKAEKNFGKYALYISFFPQLLAGPIAKAKNSLYKFEEKHYFDYERVKDGLLLMLWGYFQKTMVADKIAQLVNTVYDAPEKYKGFEIVIATVFYAFQIYCDFSSYSNIATGAAEVMGFSLPRNFERPYFSKSIKEFWRRWHMSLTSWFKDYLYFPLGGSRCSKARNYFNVAVVFLTSGLWHGSNFTFAAWGLLHGIYYILESILKPVKKKLTQAFNINTDAYGYKVVQVLTTFVLVDFAWLFFRANSFRNALLLIKNMISFNPEIFIDGSLFKLGLRPLDFLAAMIGIIIVIIADLLQRRVNIRNELSKRNMAFRWLVYMMSVLCILIFGTYGDGNTSQQFIYLKF